MAAVMVWRGFSNGTRQGQPDDPGTPAEYGPDIFAPGPWPQTAAPWLDVQEDPDAPGLPMDLVTADPQYPRPDVGALPIVGPYMPWEIGPVTAFGEEQNVGRTMRFATNSVMRGDPDGVHDLSYADELAASLQANGQGVVSDNEVYSNLLMYR